MDITALLNKTNRQYSHAGYSMLAKRLITHSNYAVKYDNI